MHGQIMTKIGITSTPKKNKELASTQTKMTVSSSSPSTTSGMNSEPSQWPKSTTTPLTSTNHTKTDKDKAAISASTSKLKDCTRFRWTKPLKGPSRINCRILTGTPMPRWILGSGTTAQCRNYKDFRQVREPPSRSTT